MADKDLDEGWRLELQPTLIELANHLRKSPPSDRPVALPIGSERITVTPAEREVLLRAAQRGGAGVPRHFLLVSDGVSLRAKLIEVRAELEAAAEDARPQAAAKVRHHVDIGFGLIRAMQGEMAVLMSTGKVEHGRRLAEHRGFVSEAVQSAQRKLTDAGFEPVVTPHHASNEGWTGTSSAFDRLQVRGRVVSKWLPQLVAGLLLALLVVLLLQLWAGRERDLPQVTVTEFAFLPGVETVVCRPPGVILLIPDEQWLKLSKPLRAQAMESSVKVVEYLGYRRLEIRSNSGAVLAEWRKGGRVSVRD